MNNISTHEKYMKIALEEASNSSIDVPVGAVLIHNGQIIAKAHNKKEHSNDPTAHAEILAIQEASKKFNNWRLENTALYVTLEPCPMCASAILYSRIPLIVYGAYDPIYGALGSAIDMTKFINYKPQIIGGIEEERCSKLLKDFFSRQRVKCSG